MVTVEQLYKDFGVLADAKDKAGEHKEEFLSIVSGVKGNPNEKRLASQFITRFFKYFPDLSEQVLDAMFDLCEDEDINIRRQAIKDLPTLCKGSPQHLPRIADVLTQLLQTEETAEISMVQSALINLFHTDAKGCLNGLFSQILQGDDMVRDRAIKFLHTKLQTLTKEIWTSEVENMFITESRKVLKDVTGEEFVIFINMLSNMETMRTLKGRQELLDIVTEQAELEQPFEASEPDSVDRLMQCVRQALPFFSKNVHSGRFVVYICDKVLPELGSIKEGESSGEGSPAVDLQLEMLKLLAEMSLYMGELENINDRLEKLYTRLLEYMPLPPSEENAENTNENETPKLQFSYVECLMFCFHQMAAKHPEFLTGEEHAERLKDFRLRLQYFARGVQVYIKQLKMALHDKTGEALMTDENKIKVVALKITNNINTLIKDLFHNPPAYKANVTLSWKPIVAAKTGATAAVTSPGQKRPGIEPITFDGVKKSKASGDRAMYAPPSGKFSDKAGAYNPQQNRGRGGYRGRGGFRGRGRGRGGYRGNYRNYNNAY